MTLLFKITHTPSSVTEKPEQLDLWQQSNHISVPQSKVNNKPGAAQIAELSWNDLTAATAVQTDMSYGKPAAFDQCFQESSY